MSIGAEERRPEAPVSVPLTLHWIPPLTLAAGGLLLIYLCWRILAPFLLALCWAFALALTTQPVYAWLLRKGWPRNLAAVAMIFLAAFAVIGPAAALTGALAKEASAIAGRVGNQSGINHVRGAIENSGFAGPAFRWLDARFDLPDEALRLSRSLAVWASGTISTVLAASMWLLAQVTVALFVLFYFLRDGVSFTKKLRSILPLTESEADFVFRRVAQTIQVSLGGKIVVAGIQGTLGGLMFCWLGVPAPVLWGCLMAVLSIFPIIGSFVVWLPAAAAFALRGEWGHASLLIGWGVIVIHPVDNLLGPMPVGSALHLHTLLMFFSILGGLVAFGASGIVLGPVTVAVVVALMELAGGGAYSLPFADMNGFYAYLATLAGTTPSAIESRISALGLFSDPKGSLTPNNLNVINLGNAAFTNEIAFTNALSQMGFTGAAAPALPIPAGVLITISRTAAAELANALSAVGATAALIFAAVVVADGHAWQNDKEELCYQQYRADQSTRDRRFPYPSSKGKYLACTGHAMTRYILRMKGEPAPPLQPEY